MLSDFTKDTSRPGRKPKPIDAASLQLARQTIRAGHKTLRTWDAVAAHYGISKAAAHRLAKDNRYRPSQVAIDKVLTASKPAPPLVPVTPCPSCAARGITRSHGDGLDCNGNGGHAIVLADGQRVATKRKPRQYSRIADMPVPILARAIRERQAWPGMEGME